FPENLMKCYRAVTLRQRHRKQLRSNQKLGSTWILPTEKNTIHNIPLPLLPTLPLSPKIRCIFHDPSNSFHINPRTHVPPFLVFYQSIIYISKLLFQYISFKLITTIFLISYNVLVYCR
ncbi:hypothetical protein VIGAN_04055200, partial [Vigna angularis var. angularis]